MRRGVLPVFAILMLLSCIDDAPITSSEFEIIGGFETPNGLFSATGALLSYGEVSCTGTLISPTVVLTAGHCVDPLFVGGQIPRFTLERDGNDPSAYVVKGAEGHRHPDFDLLTLPAPGVQQWNDIGVLILEEPVEGIAYERLPTPDEAARALEPDTSIDIVGYGMTDLDSIDFGIKMHAQSSLVELGSHEFSVGKPGQPQNCNGDSGGPGFVTADAEPRLYGIVSRSPDQDPSCDHGSIHTRVDPYVPWIISVAPQLCEELGCSDDGVVYPDDENEQDGPSNENPSGSTGTSSQNSRGGCSMSSGGSGVSRLGPWALACLMLMGRRRGGRSRFAPDHPASRRGVR